MPGDTKILPQHIARKNIGRHQILDRVAVLKHRTLDLLSREEGGRGLWLERSAAGVKCFLQIDVQGNHASLYIDMLDDHFAQTVAVAVIDL